jgi:hypothetical protein
VNDEALPKHGPPIWIALRYRDFRLLWVGLMISNLGTWMQFTAMGYFVAANAGTPHRAALNLGFLGAPASWPTRFRAGASSWRPTPRWRWWRCSSRCSRPRIAWR